MKRLLVLLCLIALPTAAHADVESDARATLDAWLAAQNGGDFAAYSALYAKKFVGIRRTADGAEKKMKLKAWKADRKKMFKRSMKVAADDAKIVVGAKGVAITFLQRWQSGKYADHGTKHLTLTADGKLISKEELLSSTPGWDDDPSKVLDATALVSPITIRVKGGGLELNGDCHTVTWVLYLKDKKGKVLQEELGTGSATLPEVHPDTIPVAPDGDTGTIYAMGDACGEVEGRTFEIRRSGDALTILQQLPEWEYGESDAEQKLEPFFTVQLPAGAKVKTK